EADPFMGGQGLKVKFRLQNSVFDGGFAYDRNAPFDDAFLLATDQHRVPLDGAIVSVKASLAFAAHGQNLGYRESRMKQSRAESIPCRCKFMVVGEHADPVRLEHSVAFHENLLKPFLVSLDSFVGPSRDGQVLQYRSRS